MVKTKREGFPGRLRNLRREKNFSQLELGKIIDVHSTHIGRYERGMSRPTAETLRRLAEALGVTADYLLGGAVETAIAKAKLEDQELLRHFQELEKLPEEDKIVIKKLIDAFLTKKKLRNLAD